VFFFEFLQLLDRFLVHVDAGDLSGKLIAAVLEGLELICLSLDRTEPLVGP
jgi:hypothetical protein